MKKYILTITLFVCSLTFANSNIEDNGFLVNSNKDSIESNTINCNAFGAAVGAYATYMFGEMVGDFVEAVATAICEGAFN